MQELLNSANPQTQADIYETLPRREELFLD